MPGIAIRTNVRRPRKAKVVDISKLTRRKLREMGLKLSRKQKPKMEDFKLVKDFEKAKKEWKIKDEEYWEKYCEVENNLLDEWVMFDYDTDASEIFAILNGYLYQYGLRIEEADRGDTNYWFKLIKFRRKKK